MLKLNTSRLIGLDLAGKSKNPSGIAILEGRNLKARLVYTDTEILEVIEKNKPELIAIDAPLNTPLQGFSRKADRDMIKNGYRVLPPKLTFMNTLTSRAVKLNKRIKEKHYRTIEVHPTSSRKALQIALKDWKSIQETLKALGLQGELQTRRLITHELDAATAALTARLHIDNRTDIFGDEEEGYIVVPKKGNWRNLQV
ncbi:MAG: DUF429 domain-containing protein [Candidatus Bathyarchaeota archaeon]|nr:DUF429 domain-containing protein [Candidatus Bathyarchaeota archaeon]